MIFTPHQNIRVIKGKESEMAKACGTFGEEEMCITDIAVRN